MDSIITVSPTQPVYSEVNVESLQSLMLRVMHERNSLVDLQVRDMAKVIESKNKLLKEFNVHLQVARTHQSDAAGADEDDATVEVSVELVVFLDANEVVYPKSDEPPTTLTADEWSILIENMQTGIDSLTSTSSTDLLDLQGLLQNFNEGVKQLTNFMSTNHNEIDAIIQGLRL